MVISGISVGDYNPLPSKTADKNKPSRLGTEDYFVLLKL